MHGSTGPDTRTRDHGRGGERREEGRQRSRGWCFTDNRTDLGGPTFKPDMVKFAVWQRERGGRTGHEHYQGYVYFKNTVSFKQAKQIIGTHAHIERAKGSMQQNIDYCTKEDTRCETDESGPYTFGDFTEEDLVATQRCTERGGIKKSTLDQWGERAKHRGGIQDIIDNHAGIYVRHYNGLHRLRAWCIQPRDGVTHINVEVRTGPSGSGKSSSVYSQFSHSEIYSKDETRWWDGYDGHQVVVFDDFAGDTREIPPTQLLKILDRYPLRVQTKGGYIQVSTVHFIITSTVHHHEWYGGAPEWVRQIQAFERRVTAWRTFPEEGIHHYMRRTTAPTHVERDPYTGQVYTNH